MIPVQADQPRDRNKFQLRSANEIDSAEREVRFFNYYTCVPPPLFIIIISVFEIAYFFVDQSNGENLMYDPRKRNEFWRFITYIFVHTR